MQTRTRNTFTTIHTEGALLPADLLQRILDGDKSLDGLSPETYHLPAGEKLNEAHQRVRLATKNEKCSLSGGA